MAEMTKRERLQAALAGRTVDRQPVAFWRHWPIDDQDAEALARATLDYQRRFDFDLIKVTPSGSYSVDAYGAKHAYRGMAHGSRDYLERVIKRVEDWDRIEPLDVSKGAYGRQLRCLRMVVDQRDPDTPVIQTIFSPIGMSRFLAGEEAYIVHLRREPERVVRALQAIAETARAFARAAIAEGADGIFLATASASFDMMSEVEYRQFCRPYDLAVLAGASDGWLNVLHLHGQHPMFEQLAGYPVHAINWHDRTAWPSLKKAALIFPGSLMGGIEQHAVLQLGTPSEVEAQVRDAIEQMGGRRLIVSAGCTYPLTVPEGNLLAARRAVESVAIK